MLYNCITLRVNYPNLNYSEVGEFVIYIKIELK